MTPLPLRIRDGINRLLAVLVSTFLMFMTALVVIQVFSRYVLNSPTAFTEEIVRYALIWTGFLGAAYAFGTRQHMALIFFKDKLAPKTKQRLDVAIDLLVLIFAVAVMMVGGSKLVLSTINTLSPLLQVPRGLVYLIGPFSGVLIAMIQLVNVWEDLHPQKEVR